MLRKRNKVVVFIVAGLFLINASGAAEEWITVAPDKKILTVEEIFQQPVNLEYKNADVVNILRSFAWTYNLNVVTSPDVKGTVTVNLKNVSVENALKAILNVNGLVYSVRDDIIYVSSGGGESVEFTTEVIFLDYIRSADAQNLLRKVLSAKGDIKTDDVQNSLIITDYPVNIQRIKDLLKKVDIPPQQILVEAKVVDITSNEIKALGTTWNVDYAPGQGLFDRITQTAEEADLTMSMAEQSSTLTGGQFVLNTFSIKGLNVTATIDALIRDGKANLLASPSIAVLNGQEARIIIGQRYPIKERTQTTTGTTETTTFVDIGTTLKVTPQINDDGYITMRVHPEVSSLAESLDAGPRITTREADTTVRVREGETLVIGGLIKQQSDVSRDKIPFLGDIPFLGALFSRTEGTDQQTELAVFITPRILRSREEKKRLNKEEAEEEETHVHIEKTAELCLTAEILRKAKALDKGKGVESVRKDKHFRKQQALNLYMNIYTQFPDGAHAPEALYLAGKIYQDEVKDYAKAKEVFSQVISDYPNSFFVKDAKEQYRIMSLSSYNRVSRTRKADLKVLTEDS
ncbi:MAG: secretin N-terminal domain-containing protein [Candidatus Omnitrophota bacterium]